MSRHFGVRHPSLSFGGYLKGQLAGYRYLAFVQTFFIFILASCITFSINNDSWCQIAFRRTGLFHKKALIPNGTPSLAGIVASGKGYFLSSFKRDLIRVGIV